MYSQQACLVCRDYKKVNSQSNDYEIAYRNLNRITRNIKIDSKTLRDLDSRKYHKYFSRINSPSIRLMCGSSCNKVSTHTCKRNFDLLKNECKKIVYTLLNCNSKSDFDKLKNESLRLLRGPSLSDFYYSINLIKFNEGER